MPESSYPSPGAETAGVAGSQHGPASGMRALVVQDEPALAAPIGSYFERECFDATITHDGLEAVVLAREVDPDVVVLDLGLPRLDGVEVCRQLRTLSDAYVVILTARSDEVDTLIGLSVGANDSMTKSFSRRELMARVHAMLRRPRPLGHPNSSPARTRSFGALSIDPVGRDVWLDGELVALTRTEFDLLVTLSGRPHMAFSHRQVIDDVWGRAWVGDEHLVDVHIGHLRRRLVDDAADSRYARTARGIGYRIGTGA